MRFRKLMIVLACLLASLVWGCEGTDPIIEPPEEENPGQQTNPNPENQNPPNENPTNPPVDNPQNHGSQLVTAEDWARARIAHTVTTEEAFDAISQSTGFPIETDDNTVIFMHWYNGGNWSVAGDFNGWSLQQMTNDGDVWYAEVQKPADDQLYYKFVNNGEYSADPWALRYNYDEYGEISYVRKPSTAHLMRWNRFRNPQGLLERTVHAWIPANPGPYKVLYAHDGQNLFDNMAIGGGWKLPENMAKIGGNFIVVGINNTNDRMNEYTHCDDMFDGVTYPTKGDQYAAFVNDTVRPFIEARFETNGVAGLMGSSLGGLISLYIAHLYPGRYQAVLALSPTTAWGDFGLHNKTMREIYMEDGHRNILLYLDNGGGEGEGCHFNSSDAHSDETNRDNYCYTRWFVDSMESIGYKIDVDLFHWFEPNALHNEEAWAARVFRPLQLFKDL